MITYLGSLVQFSPATGRVGHCRQICCVWIALTMFRPHWVCPAHGCLCFPRLHCSGSRLLYMKRALCCVRFQFSGTPEKCRFSCACVLCLPQPEWLRQPGAWAHSPWVQHALSPPGPQPQFLRLLVGYQRLVFVLRSWPLDTTLPAADVDHPESQEFFR